MRLPSSLKRALRTGQTLVPESRSIKFGFYNALTRNFGRHVEPEFRLLAQLKPISLAIDVGANWGQSIEAIRYYGKPAQIASFEPNPPLARRLEGIFAGSSDVTIHACALGDEEGTMPLHTPIYGRFVFDGETSFDEEQARAFVNPETMAWFDPNKVKVESRDVPIRILDSLELAPDVIKLDVQGFEYNVLKGAKAMFASHRPFTILENPSSDVVEFFKAIDMASYVLRETTLKRGEISDHNTVFMTDDCAKRLAQSGEWQLA